MDENKIEIEFKTIADASGAKEIRSELEKVKGAVKEQVAPTKEATEATSKWTEQKKNLIANLKQLSHEIPGMHQAIVLLRNPFSALGVAVAFAVNAFRNYTQAVEEAARSEQSFQSITASFGKFRAIIQESKGRENEFAESLNKIAQSAGNAASQFERLIAQMKRQQQAEAEQRSAGEALALARLEERGAKENWPESWMIQGRKAIRQKFAGLEFEAKGGGMGKEAMATIDAIFNLEGEAAGAEADLPGAKAATIQAQKQGKVTGRFLEVLTRQKGPEMDKLIKELYQAQQNEADVSRYVGMAPEQSAIAKAHYAKEAERLQSELEAIFDLIDAAATDAKAKSQFYDQALQHEKDLTAKILEVTKAQAEKLAALQVLDEQMWEHTGIGKVTFRTRQAAEDITANTAANKANQELQGRVKTGLKTYSGQVSAALHAGGPLPEMPSEMQRLIQQAQQIATGTNAALNIVIGKFEGVLKQLDETNNRVRQLESRRQFGISDQ